MTSGLNPTTQCTPNHMHMCVGSATGYRCSKRKWIALVSAMIAGVSLLFTTGGGKTV